MKSVYNHCLNLGTEDVSTRDYYYFGEIILGMREEYKKQRNLLDELNPLVAARGNYSANDFVFLVVQLRETSEIVLTCDVIRREMSFQKLVSFLRYITGLYCIECVNWEKDEDGNYYIGLRQDPVWVKEGKNEEFGIILQKILNTEFTKKVMIERIPVPDGHLTIGQNRISLFQKPATDLTIFTNYLAIEDTIQSSFNQEVITKNDVPDSRDGEYYMNKNVLQKMLELQIDKSVLPNYHQSIIEKNMLLRKTLTFKEDMAIKSGEVKFEETDQQITLNKVKKKIWI